MTEESKNRPDKKEALESANIKNQSASENKEAKAFKRGRVATSKTSKSKGNSKSKGEIGQEQQESYGHTGQESEMNELAALQKSRQMGLENNPSDYNTSKGYSQEQQAIWNQGYEAGRRAANQDNWQQGQQGNQQWQGQQGRMQVYNSGYEQPHQGRNYTGQDRYVPGQGGQHQYQSNQGYQGNTGQHPQQGQWENERNYQGQQQQYDSYTGRPIRDSSLGGHYRDLGPDQHQYRSFESGNQDQDTMHSYGQEEQYFQGRQPHFNTRGAVRGESHYAGSQRKYGNQNEPFNNGDWQQRDQYRSHDYGYGENFNNQNLQQESPREQYGNQNSYWGGSAQPQYEQRNINQGPNSENDQHGNNRNPDNNQQRNRR